MKSIANILAISILILDAACVRSRVPVDRPEPPDNPLTFSLAGQFGIPPLGRFPRGLGLRFGGISGLAAHSAGQELLGVPGNGAALPARGTDHERHAIVQHLQAEPRIG